MTDDLELEMELFHLALDSTEHERAELLAERCGGDRALAGRVERLVRAHEGAGPTGEVLGDLETDAVHRPDRIGPYAVLDRLGEGGMGVVFSALQSEPVEREVAVKLIRSGSHSSEVVGRFRAESQAMARMSHPNIAQVLDAGLHDDRPYFVMERIEGRTITEHCDARRATIDDRLRLFVAVCTGVQHAHQKGVIHRDLKPSNVLVAEADATPTPKVIDFGIAKATGGGVLAGGVVTEEGRIVGTPDYMSPEQCDLAHDDVDTRTDVYSLGALLYQLLAGATVFGLHESLAAGKLSLDEMRATIRERMPQPPSERIGSRRRTGADRADEVARARARHAAQARSATVDELQRVLRRDLDWITLRALSKERDRRYGSASELAADVQRYLDGEPVEARPPSASYRVSKFVRRHRAATVAGVAALFALVIASVVSTAFGIAEREQRHRAERANDLLTDERIVSDRLRDDAIASRNRALAMIDFLTDDLLAAARPTREGYDVTISEALETAAQALDERAAPGGDLADSRGTVAMIRGAIGVTYGDLERFEEAETQLALALPLAREHLGPHAEETLEILAQLGPALHGLGLFEEAEAAYREAYDTAVEAYGEESPDTLLPLGNLGVFLSGRGRIEEAAAIQRECLERRRVAFGESDEGTLMAANNLAQLLVELGDRDAGIELAERYRAVAFSSLGEDHPMSVTLQYTWMLVALTVLGDQEKVLRETARFVDMAHAAYGPEHSQSALALNFHGSALRDFGRPDEALDVLSRAADAFEALHGAEHPQAFLSRSNVADVLARLDRFDEAVVLMATVVERAIEGFPPDHPNLAVMHERYARALEGVGRSEDAAAQRRLAEEVRGRRDTSRDAR